MLLERQDKIIAPNGHKTTVPHNRADWRALRNTRQRAERLAALPVAKAERS